MAIQRGVRALGAVVLSGALVAACSNSAKSPTAEPTTAKGGSSSAAAIINGVFDVNNPCSDERSG